MYDLGRGFGEDFGVEWPFVKVVEIYWGFG